MTLSLQDGHRESAARSKRRLWIEEHGHEPTVHVILPEPHQRKHGPLLLLPYPSEIFPTEYNQRLPEWRWRAGTSAYRDHWRNAKEYFMVALGSNVGLSNFVQFPILALKYQHGTFLYAYILLEFLIGFPMLFLHLALGQFTAKDATWVFCLVPLARGIGISFMIYTVFKIVILNVELSWITYFMFASLNMKFTPSFSWQLPWVHCDLLDEDIQHQRDCNHYPINLLDDPQFYCITVYFHNVLAGIRGNCSMDHAYGEHVSWEVHWPLVGCLLFVTCLVYAIAFRGLKTMGRFVLVAVPCMCVLLLALSLVQIFLDNDDEEEENASLRGVRVFFTPQGGTEGFDDWDVWFAAVSHVVQSLSLDTGANIYIGSNARFQSAAHYHAFYIVVVDVIVSTLSGIIIFSQLGVINTRIGEGEVNALNLYGPVDIRSYLFYVISSIEAMEDFAAPFLCVYFFFVLSLGVMKLMASEAVVLNPIKEFYQPLKTKWRHLADAVVGFVLVLLTVPFLTKGTTIRYTLMTMLHYAPMTYCPILLIMFTAIAFVYVYGLQRLRQDIDFMLQAYPNIIYCALWYSTPFLCAAFIIGNIIVHVQVVKPRRPDSHWAILWFLFCMVVLPVVMVAIWTFVSYYKKGELSKILHPLDTYAPQLHEMDALRSRAPMTTAQHDPNLPRIGAITTLSSMNDSESKQTMDTDLLDLSIVSEKSASYTV